MSSHQSAIPHPTIIGLRGKMALKKFTCWIFDDFKNENKLSFMWITRLKYVVLGNMLKNLGINPFDLPEAKLYKNDP